MPVWGKKTGSFVEWGLSSEWLRFIASEVYFCDYKELGITAEDTLFYFFYFFPFGLDVTAVLAPKPVPEIPTA